MLREGRGTAGALLHGQWLSACLDVRAPSSPLLTGLCPPTHQATPKPRPPFPGRSPSTMFLTMKRLIALSLGTSTPEDSQRTRLTWPRPLLLRPPFLLFFCGRRGEEGGEGGARERRRRQARHGASRDPSGAWAGACSPPPLRCAVATLTGALALPVSGCVGRLLWSRGGSAAEYSPTVSG